MATVFMRWLERRPSVYDRGIRMLTLGRLEDLQADLISQHIQPGMQVLELGCGTGALAIHMAQAGAQVTAIDHAPNMLALAEERMSDLGLRARIELRLMDAAEVGVVFEGRWFDRIVSSLAFSEMEPSLRDHLLQTLPNLLSPQGQLLVIDEAVPQKLAPRILYTLIRLPLIVTTWLLTRTTTTPMRDFEESLYQRGWSEQVKETRLLESLRLWVATPSDRIGVTPPPAIQGTLIHRRTLRTTLLDLWELFFRIIPPYPKVSTGLYAIGTPNPSSPVLVTGNFDLTVRRLTAALDGLLAAWVLVVDSSGINVWCGAGAGYLNAERVIGAMRQSHLEKFVSHHRLILPQLCANGVAGWKIAAETGWQVDWGPVQAEDIPEYLDQHGKTDEMRTVAFPLRDRLEMTTVTLGFYGLLLLIPIAIFWRSLLLPVALSLVSISYFYAVALPWIPGRDGLAKSIPLTLITVLGMTLYTLGFDPADPPTYFNRLLGMVAVSVFVAGEMQGMSPQMRGEQANWLWEGAIFTVLLVLFFGVPALMGWR